MSKFAHLNLFVAGGYGYHEAAWRMPGAPRGTLGLPHYVDIARAAERGVLDSIFFADSPGVAVFRTRFMAQAGFDPIDLLAALAPVTSHLGLLATASTTYGTPWDVARRFATLDHLSAGRAGWNIVTTGNPIAAGNFGDRPHAAHEDRYRRAREFVEVVREVWDGWDDDAVIAGADSGEWADKGKLHPPEHRGEFFSVAGVLPLPRSPQGHPVLVQAGASADGMDLGASYADLIFTPQSTIEEAVAFRRRMRDLAVAHGRSADDIRTLPGLSFVLGSTEAEATRAWEDLQEASSPEFRRYNLAYLAGANLDAVDSIDPDGPFPYWLFEQASSTTHAGNVMKTARTEGLTFRQTADRFATLPGGLHVTGTPEQVADVIEQWWRAGAADGVTLQPLRLPLDAHLFVEHVSPLLQARGVTRREYTDGTLRDQLGLPRPPDHAHRSVVGRRAG
ncbi:MAG: NtaA/DmoA family FMN-dependent monooxygenase [Acidimicrobiaceae bacterium]|nr:NtaA/DmoA family FMN-dependent monooxygenase [Acidimicrobiaceae bacterium]